MCGLFALHRQTVTWLSLLTDLLSWLQYHERLNNIVAQCWTEVRPVLPRQEKNPFACRVGDWNEYSLHGSGQHLEPERKNAHLGRHMHTMHMSSWSTAKNNKYDWLTWVICWCPWSWQYGSGYGNKSNQQTYIRDPLMSLVLAIWAHCSSTVRKDSTSGDRSVSWTSLTSSSRSSMMGSTGRRHGNLSTKYSSRWTWDWSHLSLSGHCQPPEKDEIRAMSHELFTYRLLIFWCNSITIHQNCFVLKLLA